MVAALKAVALGLVVVALYGAHVQSGAFVYEDRRLVDPLDRPTQWAGVMRGRGLTYESWTLIRTPQAAHALNGALHLVVVALTGLLLWQITGSGWWAQGGAAIVALHPITVEAVAYAAGRADLIAAIGVLGALTACLAGGAWLLVVPFAAAVAYAGKETAIVGLALLPLVLWARRDVRTELVAWILCGSAAILSAIWWPRFVPMLAAGESVGLTVEPWPWLLAQAEAIWRLVVLSVAPLWLSVAPSVTGDGLPGLAALVLLAGLLEGAWRTRETHPRLAFGLLWCAIVAAPRLLVRTPGSVLNEHQWYLALPGVACVLLTGIEVVAARLTAWREAVA